MNNKNMISALRKPAVYTKSKAEFWNDEYISRQMLKAHLDPDFEGASRKLEFINQSVSWIRELVSPSDSPMLLDIGCGPGIYAEKFAQAGYQVTGIDFSKRSIEYARQSADENGFDISYLYQNYLNMELERQFDFATMIYCDYGALSTDDRKVLLQAIYRHLKPGGKLLLDVFSMTKYRNYQEQQNWEICHSNGFWRKEEYVALNGYYKYPDNVTLDLITVISDEEITPYYLWNTYFTKDMLIREAGDAGFRACGFYGDVAGHAVREESETIAILLKKDIERP